MLDRLRHWRVRRALALPKLLRAFADAYPDAFFVEIGANDGDEGDHLRPYVEGGGWRGIMVEPVPYVFERLQARYGDDDRLVLERAVIADRDGRVPFFQVREATAEERAALPHWYDHIGSLSRAAVLGHAADIPDIEARVIETELPALTYESLLRRHAVERVDLLAIDTEGYDARILATVDLDDASNRPRLILYEHYHLDASERAACRERIEAAGYETMEEGFDTLCLDPAADERVVRAWRRLKPGVPAVTAAEDRG